MSGAGVHPDIRGLAVARRVLADPRSSDRALRAALADTLRIVSVMQEHNAEFATEWWGIARQLRDEMAGQVARYRPPAAAGGRGRHLRSIK